MPDTPSGQSLFTWKNIAVFILGTALFGCIGFFSQVYPALFQAFELATRYGELSYLTHDGQWREISGSDAQRKSWGEGDAFLQLSWEPLGEALWYGRIFLKRDPNPQQVELALVRLDPEKWTLSLAYLPEFAPSLVADIASTQKMTVAINASFFSEAGPIGLVIDKGQQLRSESRKWAAHLLVSRDGVPQIVNEKNSGARGAWVAIQGFPAIMSNGQTYAYMRIGGRGFDVRAIERRSSICMTRDKQVILLATDSLTNGLSLSELATLLGGLGCQDAMGLDGGTSTGMVIDTPTLHKVIPNLKPVPVVLGVTPAP